MLREPARRETVYLTIRQHAIVIVAQDKFGHGKARSMFDTLPADRCESTVLRISSLLAIGLRRWHQQRHSSRSLASPDSASDSLEVSPVTVLSVVTPVNGAGDTTRQET